MLTFSDYMIDSYKKISFSKDKKRLHVDRKWIIIKILRKNSIRITEFTGNTPRKD